MAGFDDVTRRAQEFLASDKVKNTTDKVKKQLNSEKAEQVSDKVLGGAAGLANKLTKGKYEDRIESARKAADEKLGNDKPGPDTTGTPGTPGIQ
jgi:hypothetical protein